MAYKNHKNSVIYKEYNFGIRATRKPDNMGTLRTKYAATWVKPINY